MLGIDIVDLKDPSLRDRTDRTLRFVKNENDVLIDHPNAFWVLWAAKEAIFKCRREAHNFTPTQIPVQLESTADGITFTSNELQGKVIVNENYILALCGDLNDMAHEVYTHRDKNWSEGIRKMIIDSFREKGHDYYIGSDELNLPILEPSKEEISISHHARYGAVAYPKKLN